MKSFYKTVTIIILICFVSYAQDAKPDRYQDSLQTVIDKSNSKAIKKEALFLLGEHLVQRNPELAEKIANKLKDTYLYKSDSNAIARNNYIFAASHRWKGDYKTSLEYYKTNYNYYKRKKDSINIAKSGHFMGSILMFLGNNVESQSHLIEVAKIYDKIGTSEEKARINNSLAGLYLNLNQFEKSKDQYLKALKQFEILKDSSGMSSANANLGFVYTELGDFKKAEKHLMEQKKLNKVFPTLREMGFHHDFLGLLRQKQGRLQEAYQEHLTALQIREKLSSTYNLCESKLNMGEILIKLKRNSEAISHLKDIFKYDEHESLNQQQSAYELLSQAYENLGDYKESLINYKAFKKLSDSIYSSESLEIIAEKDALYDKQKKDVQIALLNKEKEISDAKLLRSNTIVIVSLVGIGLLLLASFGLYKLYTKIKSKNVIINKTLKDRELLLHETHHRVKNNLQMISSLLNLQSKYVEDKKAFEVLQNGRNRIESIAILHKNLYAGDNLTMVNIQEYFENLTSSILKSYEKSENDIKIDVKASNVVMDIESVIPIGFIVNELVTNSLKHAVPKNSSKNLEINIIMTESDSDYNLIVSDNGIGIEDEIIKNGKKESFGQRLIRSFVQKLKAQIEIKSNNGTEVSILIPKKINATTGLKEQ
jgi:two-component system, sensor histidine kinase PdtaS